MGLDAVEIVIETEKTFDIEITNAEAEAVRTPREFAALVANRISATPDDRCLTQHVFHRLRKGFASAVPALMPECMPATSVKEAVHRDQWPRVWTAIRAASDADDWPQQVRLSGLLRGDVQSVRDLVWYIAIHTTPRSGAENWTKGQVQHAVRRIICDVSGVPLSFDDRKTFRALGID